jgi:acyl-coenzyme A thioesterase PaaI-like protein
MKALLKGPTAAERAAGLDSAVASQARLNHLTVSGGVATVDLSRYPTGAPTDVALGQIVYTLTRFPTIKRVRIQIDGSPLVSADVGNPASGIFRRADFDRLEPAIFVESPGVGAVLTSPFVLRGSASVFEGSFVAVLADSSGRRVVRKQVQASQGAPGRGVFRMTIPYTTSATAGTLIVYSVSMEDGSRQGEVRIPVTFAQD